MKKILNLTSLILISLFLITACVEDNSYSFETKVKTFSLTPSVPGRMIVVTKTDTVYTSTDSIVLKWNRTQAENGTPVYYSVVFAGQDGNFENPSHIISSNNIGWDDTLKLSPKTLDLVAEKCGIGSQQTGVVRWKVKAGNGVNSVLSDNESSFSVSRPKGIADYPITLFMMGSATEAGDSIQKAIKGSYVRTGTFEFITTLKPGNYYFVSSKKGDAKAFQVTDGAISFGKNSISPATEEKLYRIRMVLYNAESTLFEIHKMELIIPDVASSATKSPTQGLVVTELDYKGNGIWEKKNVPGQKPDGSAITNGLQYKFRMGGKFAGDVGMTDYYYGYFTDSDLNANAGVPNNTSPESWYYCKETNKLDKNYYRFPNGTGGKKFDIAIYLTPGLKNYYHSCTIIEE